MQLTRPKVARSQTIVSRVVIAMDTNKILHPIDLTPNASGYLDIMRFVAAMAVMFEHWRGILFTDYKQIASSNITAPVRAMYFLTDFGHQAVMVFFVLSGFLISSSVLRNMERSTWSWRGARYNRGAFLQS